MIYASHFQNCAKEWIFTAYHRGTASNERHNSIDFVLIMPAWTIAINRTRVGQDVEGYWICGPCLLEEWNVSLL
jgi:hypothetical protein